MLENTNRIELNDGKDYLVYRPAGGGTVEIFDILVGTGRGVGTGTKLINLLIEKEKPPVITAITRMSNVMAQKFYKKNGFERVPLPSFYPDESGIMFIKQCV